MIDPSGSILKNRKNRRRSALFRRFLVFLGLSADGKTDRHGYAPHIGSICRAGAMFAKQTCHGAKRSMLASRRNVVRSIFRICTNERIFLNTCRGDHILAKQVCHEAKRNIESPVTLSALSFGFALTNDFPTMNGGILVRRHIVCSHRLFFSGRRGSEAARGE